MGWMWPAGLGFDTYGLECGSDRMSSFDSVSLFLSAQIATISPGMTSCENTLNTLRYANRWEYADLRTGQWLTDGRAL